MNRPTFALTIKFPQKLSYLRLATGASRLLCETIKEVKLPSSFTDEVELAVSEACTNAIRHGASGDAAAVVTVNFQVHETQMIIEVSDQGAGFNFEEFPEPAFDRHPEGGYGLYIIRSMMDTVSYQRNEQLNTLTMKKNFMIKGDFL